MTRLFMEGDKVISKSTRTTNSGVGSTRRLHAALKVAVCTAIGRTTNESGASHATASPVAPTSWAVGMSRLGRSSHTSGPVSATDDDLIDLPTRMCATNLPPWACPF
mmetsp:Transcript_18374/g.39538  ORF Transcript_18374/g.39538 Transcript_18374/m.39538 type:complete len:107 (+) Transcript_18374:1466-1786(+)